MFFAEENNKNSKGITYFMDLYGGNDYSSPGYKEKNGEKCPDAKMYYRGDLLVKNETRWFEFEWNVDSNQM